MSPRYFHGIKVDEGEWVGFDLDHTLAEGAYYGTEIGPPIPSMIARLKEFRAAGIEVRIFTARVSCDDPGLRERVLRAISSWCVEHIGEQLHVTCRKDAKMAIIFDDRAVQVTRSAGEIEVERLNEENLRLRAELEQARGELVRAAVRQNEMERRLEMSCQDPCGKCSGCDYAHEQSGVVERDAMEVE